MRTLQLSFHCSSPPRRGNKPSQVQNGVLVRDSRLSTRRKLGGGRSAERKLCCSVVRLRASYSSWSLRAASGQRVVCTVREYRAKSRKSQYFFCDVIKPELIHSFSVFERACPPLLWFSSTVGGSSKIENNGFRTVLYPPPIKKRSITAVLRSASLYAVVKDTSRRPTSSCAPAKECILKNF